MLAAFMEAVDVMRSDRQWLPEVRGEVKKYMADRAESFRNSPRGIMKRDTDTRDFLVEIEPEPRVSGMLDWEEVYRGFVLYDCLQAYLRIRVDRFDLWPYLCEGYEGESGVALSQDASVEYCLMCRCWVADNPFFDDVILSLLNGEGIPFEKRN